MNFENFLGDVIKGHPYLYFSSTAPPSTYECPFFVV